MTETENKLDPIGKAAYAAIVEMVQALECDYDRLEELREERDGYYQRDGDRGGSEHWAEDCQDEAEELADLKAQAGDCSSQDDARERILEDPLSLRIFGERIAGEWEADRFELLLATGGPAVRIIGELNEHSEPSRAWLEVQDWFLPWTQYVRADSDVLLAYCRCFCFE